MSEANNGGPAFPVSTGDAVDGHQDGHGTWQFPGISMRDYFAAKAMAALCCGFNSTQEAHNWTPADFADEAYKMADAMLRERAK